MAGRLNIKRAYAPPSEADGQRVLVDRVWPRGISKAATSLDLWLKEVAPSTELRKWFGHDPERFAIFRDRYREELDGKPDAIAQLRSLLQQGDVTLVYGAHDEVHNQAVVLADYLRAHH